MSFIDLFLIAAGLAMDAFAVALANAARRRRDCVVMGLYFGGFQGLMPLAGYLLGSAFSVYVEALSHWVALALLSFIGGRMVYGSLRGGPDEKAKPALTHGTLIIQAFATSIDAFAVGVTIALTGTPIWSAVLVIAFVTFVFVVIGGAIGYGLGAVLQRRAELAGGVVLILIGLKLFVQGALKY